MQKIQRQAHVRAPLLRLEQQQVSDDPHAVPLALLRRHEFFDLVRKQQQTDPVIVVDGAQGEYRAQLRADVLLQAANGAELPGGAKIDQQHDRQFALFHVSLDVGVASPRRYVPVDAANIITRSVFRAPPRTPCRDL